MKLEVEIIDNVLQWKEVSGFKNGLYEIEIKNLESHTRQQQKAQYLWLTQIAHRLNSENITTTQVLRPETVWTMEKVKTMFFDPVIFALFGVKTSTKLQKNQFDQIIDTLNKAFGERGVQLPAFPTMKDKENNNERH